MPAKEIKICHPLIELLLMQLKSDPTSGDDLIPDIREYIKQDCARNSYKFEDDEKFSIDKIEHIDKFHYKRCFLKLQISYYLDDGYPNILIKPWRRRSDIYVKIIANKHDNLVFTVGSDLGRPPFKYGGKIDKYNTFLNPQSNKQKFSRKKLK